MDEVRLYYDIFAEANKKNTIELVDLRRMTNGLSKILEASYSHEGTEIRVGMNLRHDDAGLIIRISGEQMYGTSSTFMSRAGIPNTVICDDYVPFDDILRPYGKRTQESKSVRRRIVDI